MPRGLRAHTSSPLPGGPHSKRSDSGPQPSASLCIASCVVQAQLQTSLPISRLGWAPAQSWGPGHSQDVVGPCPGHLQVHLQCWAPQSLPPGDKSLLSPEMSPLCDRMVIRGPRKVAQSFQVSILSLD